MSGRMVHVDSVIDDDTNDTIMGLSTVGNLDVANLDVTLGQGYQQGDLVVGRSYTIVLGSGANADTYDACTLRSCDAQYAHFRIGRAQTATPSSAAGG